MILRKVSHVDAPALFSRLDAFEKAQERSERMVRDEVALSRNELGKAAQAQRQELSESFKTFGDSVMRTMVEVANLQKVQLDDFSAKLTAFAKMSGERLDGVRAESATGAKQLREEVVATLGSLSETMNTTMSGLASAQAAQLETMSSAIGKLSDSNENKLEAIRVTVEAKLQSMQSDNARQLDQMRQTVDEKLQGTLEKRLGESFRQVSERLEQVHKGLGEMQTLATGVGDLKKVLTNVKTRGTWGEVQLGALLEQVLNTDQFATNKATKDGGERVEFAIKLPGQGANMDEVVWLPIDAKFPIEDYQRLVEAQERADAEGVETAGKQLESRVKACAKDVSEKYLNPPNTTDFGILFLPIEGLFAEVIRRTGLTEVIQREFRVVIAGPTTLWSIMNSLQMGFRTLAIQKRSSEVWSLLAAVKTEWTKYGDILDAVQKKLQQASDTIDKAKVRSRAVGRKLKDVQELPTDEATALLPRNLMELEDDTKFDEGDRAEDD
ncbi:MAG: DNA recombination protein RmuC [Nitrospirae bacterium]|nr:DNA recombination protein RmuC [Nitrospirota bacterium]